MQYGEGYDGEAQIAPGAQRSPNLDLGSGILEVGGQGNSPEASVTQAEISRMNESYREPGASVSGNWIRHWDRGGQLGNKMGW